MNNTRKCFLILTIVFLLVGLGTLAASEVTTNDTGVSKTTETGNTKIVNKDTNTVSKDLKIEDKVTDTIKEKDNKIIKNNLQKTRKTDEGVNVDVNNFTELNKSLHIKNKTININIKSKIILTSDLKLDNEDLNNLYINGNGYTIDGDESYQFLFSSYDYNITLANLNVKNCYSGSPGGVISSQGNLTVINCNFTNNRGDTAGGAIAQYGNLTIINSNISSNTADYGGALFYTPVRESPSNDFLNITDSIFLNNNAISYGGAMAISVSYVEPITGCSIYITKTKFTSNSAEDGGAIDAYGGNIYIKDSVFSKNHGKTTVLNTNPIDSLNVDASEFYDNYVTDNNGYVLDLQNITEVEIVNSHFEKNTDNTRDMLFSDAKEDAKVDIHGNTYIGNYLSVNLTKLPDFDAKGLNNETLTFPVNITARKIYNNTINTGNVFFKTDLIDESSPVKNSQSNITLDNMKLRDNNNKVNYNYTAISKDYQNAYNTFNILKEMKESRITAMTVDPTINNTKIMVKVSDEDKKPIDNAPIIITLPDGNTIETTSDKEIELDLPAKLNIIKIEYPGSISLKPVTITDIISVIKRNPIIKLDPVTGIIGENITLTAYLTDESGINITGGNLAFKLNGKTLRSDGRFDSNASAMKFNVKNGLVTYTIKADAYIRNAKNLTASYSGNSIYQESTSPAVEAQIQRRTAEVTVQVTPSKAKQYETVTITATVKDATKNGTNTTAISENTNVMLKINGKTLKDANNNTLYVSVDKDGKAVYNYTIPAGTGGVKNGTPIDYKAEAIFVSDNYYPGARNATTFNIERSNTTITIQETKVDNNNQLSVKATLKDYKGQNLVGTNKISIKINGVTLKNQKGGALVWTATNGVVNLSGIQVDKNTTIKRVMLVSSERQAYSEARLETTDIIRV